VLQRSFDVSGEEEDTPTKRAKVSCMFEQLRLGALAFLSSSQRQHRCLQELSDSQQDEYAWGQSPVLARLRTRFSSECEQAECQQLDSQTEHSRRICERSDAVQLHRTKSEPAPRSSCTTVSEDETILKEMIRFEAVLCFIQHACCCAANTRGFDSET